jgi:hypothetical protein
MNAFILVCATVVALCAASAAASEQGDVLSTLRPGHPRLIALDPDIKRVRGLVETAPLARQWRDRLRQKAEEILEQPPVEYQLIGPRLLHVSRKALDRIMTLGLIYRLEGDRRFAARAVKELVAVCEFADWHPSHFLDTAEMTHAAGLGYDWLHAVLTPEQKALVRRAIVEKGLRPALSCYEQGGGWVAARHNWNQVCNGGIAIGALALADEEAGLASTILRHAQDSIPRALAQYEPDGGWAEGPGYWHYATQYTAYFLAALDSALGTDFGLSDREGLGRAGDFCIYSVGPINQTFNFADAGSGASRAAEMFWLARRYGKPVYAWYERNHKGQPEPWDLLWFDARGGSPAESGLPLDKLFRPIEVAFFRSAWDDPEAAFIGFKGGDNQAPHSHLDLGTFVLDAMGQRWAADLGADNYNLPGYFGKERWSYYRLRTEGHNTLVINGHSQETKARAPIVAFHSTPERAFAVADLTAAYPEAARVWRGIALLDRRHVLVQDEVQAAGPVDISWNMHTPAAISVEGASATLRQKGKTLKAFILQPQGARFEVESADPGPPQARNEGVSKLVVRLPAAAGSLRLAVVLTPDGEAPALPVSALAEWVSEAGQAPGR